MFGVGNPSHIASYVHTCTHIDILTHAHTNIHIIHTRTHIHIHTYTYTAT